MHLSREFYVAFNVSEGQFFAHLTLKTFYQLVHHLYSQTKRFESPYTTNYYSTFIHCTNSDFLIG